MNRLTTCGAMILALFIAGLSANLLRQLPPSASVELRDPPVLRVSRELQADLEELRQEVKLTYWVTESSEFPASLQGLTATVPSVLHELERSSGGRIQTRILHPSAHPEAASLLAARGLRPFRSRQLVQDGWQEISLWSSLWIEYGDLPGRVFQPIRSEDLPELAERIGQEILSLESGEAPAPLSLALVSVVPEEVEALAPELSKQGVRLEVFPEAADVSSAFDALWIFGSTQSDSEISRVREYLDSGRDVLIAARGRESSELLAAFGAYVEEGELRDGDSTVLRAIAPNQDFRNYASQPNGTLNFGSALPLVFGGERLAELGRSLEPLAWTNEGSIVVSENGVARSAPKRPLLTLLDPQSSSEGRLVVAASTGVFGAEDIQAEDPAHRNLTRLLLEPDAGRLALSRVRASRSMRVPTLSVGERSTWRTIVIFSGPLFLLLAALWRGLRKSSRGPKSDSRTLRLAAVSITCAVVCAGAAGATFHSLLPPSWSADATREQTHRVSEREREFLLDCLNDLGANHDTLQLELVHSPESSLPAEFSARKRDLLELIRNWQASVQGGGAPLEWQLSSIQPEADWTEEQRSEARRLGALSREQAVTSVDGSAQALAVSELWCGLILRCGSKATAVSLLDDSGSLRFRLAFALWRLASDETIDVSFAADRSLLSSAEALLDYSERGLFAPSGGDTTHTARNAIRAAGFNVRELDPRAPLSELALESEGSDAICWLQPRRDIGPMLQVTASHLARGGSALIFAGQHEIEARQLGRDALQFEFWPRPLKTDLERDYLPQLGITLSTELYFDARNTSLPLPTRVESRDGTGQARETQLGAQPFMVRTSAQGIGDLALPSSSILKIDPAICATYGLEMTPVLSGSPQWWSYDWSGGNLPADILDVRKHQERRPQPLLAALFEGAFPEALPDGDNWRAPPASEVSSHRPSGSPKGKLLLTGNSAFLRDSLLAFTGSESHGAEYLIDGLARLTLPAALAELNHRRDAPPLLDPLPSSTRMRARVLVLGLGPGLLLLFAGLRALLSVRNR